MPPALLAPKPGERTRAAQASSSELELDMRFVSPGRPLLRYLAVLSVLGGAFGCPCGHAREGGGAGIEALIRQGIEERRDGQYRQSVQTLEDALARSRAAHDIEGENSALNFLCLTYRKLGDLKKVLALRLETLKLVRAHPEVFERRVQHEQSWTLAHVSGAYYLAGDLPNAIGYARAAVEQETKSPTMNRQACTRR